MNITEQEQKTLFITLPTGHTTSHTLPSTSNINSLKALVCSEGIKFSDLELVLNGASLAGSCSLSSPQIQNNSTLQAVVAVQGGGTAIDPDVAHLARIARLDKQICRKCYAVLNPRTKVCRKRACGHWADLRKRKALADKGTKA